VKIVGIDIGTNSIGLAAVDLTKEEPLQLLASRIFLEAVEAKSRAPKNLKRRTARGLRRQFSRRRMRRESVEAALQSVFPGSDLQNLKLPEARTASPHEIRARGLDEKLTVEEFSVAMLHISKHRGFKSNRKAQFRLAEQNPELSELIEKEEKEAPEDAETGAVKSGIAALRLQMEATGARTLGEFFYQQLQQGIKVRSTYTAREMYVEEFDRLFESQARFHTELTRDAKATLHQAIFWQRPLKIQKFLVGDCTIFKHRKRAPLAYEISQRFRMLQTVNNLKIEDDQPLSDVQRATLLAELDQQSKMSWAKVRTLLKVPKTTKFNLERMEEKEIRGNATNATMRRIAPDLWNNLKEDQRHQLLEDLLTISLKESLLKRLQEHWKLDLETAYKLAIVEFESGYLRISLKAVKKVLPHLQKGLRYDQACLEAGFHHSDLRPKQFKDRLDPMPPLRNPVVDRSLNELKKVINTYLREYGKPDVFRLELARDLKLSKKQKEELLKEQNKNKKLNEEAEKFCISFGIQNPTSEDKLKYRLWKECRGVCPYTGEAISESRLFTSEIQIEHIIPYGRCFEDSSANKTLCVANENLRKGNKTPYEAYSEEQLKVILDRIDGWEYFPKGKKARFRQTSIDQDKFVERQLNDTRYISREVKSYLETLGVRVETSTGKSTALFRHLWGLNSVLDPENAKKNREDHRHHAIDALVVALVDVSLFQKISKLAGQGDLRQARDFKVIPWSNLRHDAEMMAKKMIVSHQIKRKVSGALHEETAYGWDEKNQKYTIRKPVASLTDGEIERIRDPFLKKIIQERRNACVDSKAFQKQMQNPETAIYIQRKDGTRTPVQSIKLNAREKPSSMSEQIFPESGKKRAFAKGSNHHAEILENADGERTAVVVSTIEAKRRAVSGQPIVQMEHPEGYRTVMTLCGNDTVTLSTHPGRHFRVQKFSLANPIYLQLMPVEEASEDNVVRIVSTGRLIDLEKIVILSPLGKPV
jgi:CRISPR-associated endonuclease Csn1